MADEKTWIRERTCHINALNGQAIEPRKHSYLKCVVLQRFWMAGILLYIIVSHVLIVEQMQAFSLWLGLYKLLFNSWYISALLYSRHSDSHVMESLMFIVIIKLPISRKVTSEWEYSKIWVKSEFCQLKGKKIWEKKMLKFNDIY